MNTPIQIGLPQIVLLLIGVLGVGLLISSIMGLTRGHRDVFEDEQGRRFYSKHRRRFRWKRGVSGVLLLIVAVSLIWLTLLAQTYLGLSGKTLIGQIRAVSVDGQSPAMMSVELATYDQKGQTISDKTYIVQGDTWELDADVIVFPSWLNILGLGTSYKITRLKGLYHGDQVGKSITLNGGDDDFFNNAQKQAWSSPFVEAAYGNGTFVKADGRTYNLFLTRTSIEPVPANK